MSDYQSQRSWSDKFIPAIRSVVGPYLLTPTSFEIDTQQAADLIVLNARDMRIAARVRKHGFADLYPYEFTVRSRLPSGHKTELAKMMEGFGDWMFYGHSNASESGFSRWWIIDLNAWRGALLRSGFKGSWGSKAKEMTNRDGSRFVAFDVREFGNSILVAASHRLEELEAA